jgi:hypothetical protein
LEGIFGHNWLKYPNSLGIVKVVSDFLVMFDLNKACHEQGIKGEGTSPIKSAKIFDDP